MAINRSAPKEVPTWSRLTEWSLVAGVIVVLVLVSGRQMRVMQAQSELATVKSTLGALRTAFVIDYLHKNVAAAGSNVVVTQRNPFELLQRQPANYVGEMRRSSAEAATAGTWIFDTNCSCVGYTPIYDQGFDNPSGDAMLWFRVTAASGPLQLSAKETYVWQGQALN